MVVVSISSNTKNNTNSDGITIMTNLTGVCNNNRTIMTTVSNGTMTTLILVVVRLLTHHFSFIFYL